MNIKNIIKEEMDDLDWIRDITPLSYEQVNNNGLEFSPPITNKHYWDIVRTSLENLGIRVKIHFGDMWRTGEDDILGLFIDKGNVVWTNIHIEEGSYEEHINDFAERDVHIMDGRALFPTI